MADNVTAPAAGVVFASDDLSGVHYPYAKLAWGPDGSATPVADAGGARLPVSLAALPLPGGASTEATLAALSAKIAALESGRTPVAVQRVGTTTRLYAASQRIATSGAGSVRTAAGIAATEVTLIATVDGFFALGDGAVTAANAAGSVPIFAGIPFTLQISSGQLVAFIRAGATDGALFILPMA